MTIEITSCLEERFDFDGLDVYGKLNKQPILLHDI